MGRGKGRKRDNKNPKRNAADYEEVDVDDMMNDEIDAFHKQRDIIPLDVNHDTGESDEDTEHPVFDFKGDEEGEEEEDDDDDDDIEDDTQLTGLAAKIARQQKYLRAKLGGAEDEMHDDAEDEEENRAVWGRRKGKYYGADNVHYEIQSSDEELHDEEEEVIRLQKEKMKSLSMEDFGLEDVSRDEGDTEPTMEEIIIKGKAMPKASKEKEAQDDSDTAYEEVKKDLNALSKEEKMDIVYSSAPELVGLLSELNDAIEELENKVNPFLCKVREGQNAEKGGMNYMEMKQLLLLAYCQAITFYLLLKSEGEPVRDHPVIGHLVEIKDLLDKVKQLDSYLPSKLDDILNTEHQSETGVNLFREDIALTSDSLAKNQLLPNETQEVTVEPNKARSLGSAKDQENKGRKCKNPSDQLGVEGLEMLKVRAALEEKLKQKGIFNAITQKADKAQQRSQLLNGQLETLDDFDDDTTNPLELPNGMNKGNTTSLRLNKLSQLVTRQANKPKIVSGDDDLAKRDDIGERRRKHELRVLAQAGINSVDDVENKPGNLESDGDSEDDEGGELDSEDEFYKQVKKQRTAKLTAKAEMYSRTSTIPSLQEEKLVDGKRHISYQMEKNRGLTRPRKKLTKNPRKKYKLKHQKAVERRKGQVRDVRKPSGPYGGENTGINPGISRSIRL